MEKICPRCGARHPASAVYCDQDGSALSAPAKAPRSRRGRLAVLGLAALVFLAAGAALPRLIERYLRLRIAVELEEIRYPATAPTPSGGPGSIPGLLDRFAGLAEMLTGTNQIAIRLRVRNDTSVGISLISTTYTIAVDGLEAAKGVWNPEGKPALFAAPKDEITAEIAVSPSPEAVIAIGGDLLQGRRPEVRVYGQMTVEVLWVTFAFPFDMKDLRPSLLPPKPLPGQPGTPDLEGLEDGPRLLV